jgi:hypothetical protein
MGILCRLEHKNVLDYRWKEAEQSPLRRSPNDLKIFVLKILDLLAEDLDIAPLTVKIDPVSCGSGFSLVRESIDEIGKVTVTVVWLMKLLHRGFQIHQKMDQQVRGIDGSDELKTSVTRLKGLTKSKLTQLGRLPPTIKSPCRKCPKLGYETLEMGSHIKYCHEACPLRHTENVES